MNNGSSNKTTEDLLKLLNHYTTLYSLQRDIIDRWFRFYLLIIAAPFAIIVAATNAEIIKPSDSEQRLYLGFICGLLFIIGLIFFHMNNAQRKICVEFVIRWIHPISEEILVSLMHAKRTPSKLSRIGADFAVGLIISTTNSSVLRLTLLYF